MRKITLQDLVNSPSRYRLLRFSYPKNSSTRLEYLDTETSTQVCRQISSAEYRTFCASAAYILSLYYPIYSRDGRHIRYFEVDPLHDPYLDTQTRTLSNTQTRPFISAPARRRPSYHPHRTKRPRSHPHTNSNNKNNNNKKKSSPTSSK